jgi:hypothetical protein
MYSNFSSTTNVVPILVLKDQSGTNLHKQIEWFLSVPVLAALAAFQFAPCLKVSFGPTACLGAVLQ